MMLPLLLVYCILAGSKIASAYPASSPQHELQAEKSPARSPQTIHQVRSLTQAAHTAHRVEAAQTAHKVMEGSTHAAKIDEAKESMKSAPTSHKMEESTKAARASHKIEQSMEAAKNRFDERMKIREKEDKIRYMEHMKQTGRVRPKKWIGYHDSSSDEDEKTQRMRNHSLKDYHEHVQQRQLLASGKAPYTISVGPHHDNWSQPPPPYHGMHQVGPSLPPPQTTTSGAMHKLRKKARDTEAKLIEKAERTAKRMANASPRKHSTGLRDRHSSTTTTSYPYYGTTYVEGGSGSSSRSSSRSRRGWGLGDSPRSEDERKMNGDSGEDFGFLTAVVTQGSGSGSSSPIHHKILKGLHGIIGGSGRSDSSIAGVTTGGESNGKKGFKAALKGAFFGDPNPPVGMPMQEPPGVMAGNWLCGMGGCGGGDSDGGSGHLGHLSGLKEALPDPETLMNGAAAAADCVGEGCVEVLKGVGSCLGCLLDACVGADCS